MALLEKKRPIKSDIGETDATIDLEEAGSEGDDETICDDGTIDSETK